MQTQSKEKGKVLKLITEKNKDITMPQWPSGIAISKNKAIQVSISTDVAVVIAKNAFEQLFGWAYSTNREISCLGLVQRKGNIFIIEQFYLLKQTCSSVETELDQAAIGELIEQLLAQGKREETKRIKCWAHSHPDMETFWSGTDDRTCRLLVNDYLISIVVGNHFDLRCRIDIALPMPIVIDYIPVLYQIPEDRELLEKCVQEVKNTVSGKVHVRRKRPKQLIITDDMLERDYYCEYCGNSHREGECPLDNPANWPESIDNDFFR